MKRWLLFLVCFCFFSVCTSWYDCTYTEKPGMTIYGPTMPTSGQASAAAGEDCAAQCCNMPGCNASSWTINSAQCWFFNNNTVQTYQPSVDNGVNLYILNSKAPCTSMCPQNVTGNKRGVAYGFSSKADMSAMRRGANWWYNWSSNTSADIMAASQALGMDYVPMIWNGNFDVNYVISKIPSGTKYILGFNEPNFFSQGNLSPTQAAALWPKIEQIAKAKNLLIVGPAVNYCGPASECWATDPFEYLDAFFVACNTCRIDFVAAHLYSCSGPSLNRYIGGFRKYNKTLWLTEFSCGDNTYTEEEEYQYMQQALTILDNDPHIYRYAWFSARTTSVANVDLLGATGVLTKLGVLYTTQDIPGVVPVPPSGSELYCPYGIWYLFLVLLINQMI